MDVNYKHVTLTDVKAEPERGTFSGYGAVFGNVDSYGDVIDRGAFSTTLKAWQAKGKWPKMLLQHGGLGLTAEDLIPPGQWSNMEENRKGLKVTGRLFALNTDRGQLLYEGVKSGELDGLSIGFETVGAYDEVVDGETFRHLTEIRLWEVSLVTFPANAEAFVTAVKQAGFEQWRDLEGTLRDAGLSRRDSQRAISAFKSKFLRDAGTQDRRQRDVADTEETELLHSVKAFHAEQHSAAEDSDWRDLKEMLQCLHF